MAFFPPQVQYLSDSIPIWRGCIQTLVDNGLDESEIGAMVILWTRSLTERPCGSLPNDIDAVSSMVSATGRGSLRKLLIEHWVIGSDNRLYHPEFCMSLVDAINKSTIRALGTQLRTRDTVEINLLLPCGGESLLFDLNPFTYNRNVHGPAIDPSDPEFGAYFSSLAELAERSQAQRQDDTDILLPNGRNNRRFAIPVRDTSRLNTPERANAFDFRSLALLGGNYSIGKVNQAWLDICLHCPEGISKALLKKSIADSIRLKGQSLNISYFSAVIKSNAREIGAVQFKPFANERFLDVLFSLGKENKDALTLIVGQMGAESAEMLICDLFELKSDPKSLAIKVSGLSDSFGLSKQPMTQQSPNRAKRSAMEYL